MSRDACSQRALLPTTLGVDGNSTCLSRSPGEFRTLRPHRAGSAPSVSGLRYDHRLQGPHLVERHLPNDLTVAGNVSSAVSRICFISLSDWLQRSSLSFPARQPCDLFCLRGHLVSFVLPTQPWSGLIGLPSRQRSLRVWSRPNWIRALYFARPTPSFSLFLPEVEKTSCPVMYRIVISELKPISGKYSVSRSCHWQTRL